MTTLIEGLPGGAEWLVLLVVAVLLFGGSRLAGLGKGAGRAVREFKEETQSLRSSDTVDAETGKTQGATAAKVVTPVTEAAPATPVTTTTAAASGNAPE